MERERTRIEGGPADVQRRRSLPTQKRARRAVVVRRALFFLGGALWCLMLCAPSAASAAGKTQAASGPGVGARGALARSTGARASRPVNGPYRTPDEPAAGAAFDATLDNGASAGARPAVAADGVYDALGDSYAAGEGSSSYDETGSAVNPCHRSTQHAWAGLLSRSGAPQLHGLAFSFDACDGAIIPDIIGGTETNAIIGTLSTDDGHNEGEGLQLNHVAGASTLVTLSVGGNDVGFAPVLIGCLLFHRCRARDAEVSTTIAGLTGLLRTVYRDIKARAPRARILVMGYPHAFSLSQENNLINCYGLFGDDIRWLNQKTAQLDDVIRAAVTSSGVAEYIDAYGAFEGHGACDSGAWIHAVELGDLGESFHPKDAGQEALYKIALKQLEQGPAGPATASNLYAPRRTAYTITLSRTITASVPVAPGQDSVAFTSEWPGGDVVMSLTSPSGRAIMRATQAPDVDHQNGPTYEVYTIQRPETGEWVVALSGANVAPAGEAVDLTVNDTPHINAPPIAAYTQPASGATAATGSPLTFDASASYDTDGTIAAASWDFGDGTSAAGTTVEHTFTQTGVYTPLLTVVDNQGAQGFVSNGPITVTSSSGTAAPRLPDGAVGVPYTTTITWGGDESPYQFWAMGLPRGLTLEHDGVLHGVPTKAGSVSVAVSAADKNGGSGTRMYDLTIAPAGGCAGAGCGTPTPELGSGALLATGLAPLVLALALRRARRT